MMLYFEFKNLDHTLPKFMTDLVKLYDINYLKLYMNFKIVFYTSEKFIKCFFYNKFKK